MPFDPENHVPNHVTQLTLSLAPTAVLNPYGESETWDNMTHTINIPQASIEAGIYNILDGEELYPETTYKVEVLGATDSFGQSIPTASITVPQTFRMKNDYPAFSIFAAGNDSAEHEYTFAFSEPVDWQHVYRNVVGNPVVPRDHTVAKPLLNSTFLDTQFYQLEHLVDYSDPLLFEPNSVQNGSFNHVTKNDTDSEFFKVYYGTTLDGYNSILRSGRRTLIGFDSFNKKIGIYEIDATFVYHGILSNASTIWESDPHTLDIIGQDIEYQNDIIEHGYTVTGNESRSIKYFRTEEHGFGVYSLEDLNDPSKAGSVWLGINTKDWLGYNDVDTFGSFTVTARAKSKQNQANISTSYLSCDFFTFAKPRMNAYMHQQSSDTTAYVPVDITSIESPYMTAISFKNGEAHGYKSIKFEVSTRQERPFLPLVNVDYDSGDSVIGANGRITGFECLNDYIAPLNSNHLDIITDPRRQTAFIIESLVNTSSEELQAFDTYNSALSPITSSPMDWRVIGFSPTYDANADSIAVEEYTLPNRPEEYTIDKDLYIVDHHEGNLTTDPIDNNVTHRTTLTWPRSDFQIKDGSTNGLIENLIPGKYYAFRGLAANFCGLRVQPIVIKTADPYERTYGSHFFDPTNLSEVVFGIGPNAGDDEYLSYNIPLDSGWLVYAGESRNLTEYPNHPYIAATNDTTNYYGWESAQVNCKVSVKTPNSQSFVDLDPSSEYIERDRNDLAFRYTFDEIGTYVIKIYSNSCRLVNSNGVEGNVKCHTYNITTSAQNTLNVTTENPVLTTYNTSSLYGNYSSYGNHTIEATGFKHWAGDAEPEDATASNYSTKPGHYLSDNGTNTSFYKLGMNLQPDTEYHVKAFAVSTDVNIGIVYGERKDYMSSSPVTASLSITDITRTTAQITLV